LETLSWLKTAEIFASLYSVHTNQMQFSFRSGSWRNCCNLTKDLGPNVPDLHLLATLWICEGGDGLWIQRAKAHIADCGYNIYNLRVTQKVRLLDFGSILVSPADLGMILLSQLCLWASNYPQ